MAQGSQLERTGDARDALLGPDAAHEFATLLAQLGVDEKPARVVGFLAGNGEGRSAEIEKACELRQPEVSQATKALRERGWVVARREKRPGKGRPVNNYTLKVSLGDLVNEIEGIRREAINVELARIERLRSLAGGAQALTESP